MIAAARETRIGPYQLERKIGAGGMGVVYAAWDERLERRVALKKILSDVADEPLRRERFRREARAVAKLSHPSIVQIYDLLETPEGDWIVLEYVEGTTLTTRLMQGALDPGEVVRLARDVAGALEEAHAQGLLHRDLKAENVILTPSGRAKVLDFGLAKLYESDAPTGEATSPGAWSGPGAPCLRNRPRGSRSTRARTSSRSESCSTKRPRPSPRSSRTRPSKP